MMMISKLEKGKLKVLIKLQGQTHSFCCLYPLLKD